MSSSRVKVGAGAGMAVKRQQVARKSSRQTPDLRPAIELDVVTTRGLWDHLLQLFHDHLRKTYRGGNKFRPFAVVSAIDDGTVQLFAKRWDVPAVQARRRLAEEFVDALHLDRGDLVVWR